MHEVDQDVVVMFTLVTIFLFKFSIQNFLKFFRLIRFMRVYLGYLLLRVYVGIYFEGVLIDAFSRIVVQKWSFN